MDILLLGPPGAGKGTQGEILAKSLGIPRFATGDLLRDAVARDTPLGRKAHEVMAAGELVSDEIIMGIVRDELDKPEASNGVILDGVVRTIPQARGMAELLAEHDRQVDHVIFFEVDDDEVVARLEKRRGIEGRADDDPATVRRRLEAYRQQTAPVLDWYRRTGVVHRIDATGSIEEVGERVREALGLG